jgi:hypothetical protein
MHTHLWTQWVPYGSTGGLLQLGQLFWLLGQDWVWTWMHGVVVTVIVQEHPLPCHMPTECDSARPHV